MGNNGATFALDFGMHEHTTHGGQFLTILAAHNTRFAEQSINHGIVGRQSARMRRGGAATSCRATRLDGCNMASFVDEAA